MSRRRLFWAVGVFLAVAGMTLLAPDVRWPLWGWLRGEAFYQGRPTSYWRQEIQAWPDRAKGPAPWVARLLKAVGVEPSGPGMPFFGCSSAAVAVLVELASDDSRVESHATYHLALVAQGDDDALRALIDLVGRGRTPRARRAVAGWCINAGPQARVIQALGEALGDEDSGVRAAATAALDELAAQADNLEGFNAQAAADPLR
jgi:hypothetical protein